MAKLSMKGPKDATFAQVRADMSGAATGTVFKYKTQTHFTKANEHDGTKTTYVHERAWDANDNMIPGEKVGLSFHAEKDEGGVWRHAHDVEESGAKKGDPVKALNDHEAARAAKESSKEKPANELKAWAAEKAPPEKPSGGGGDDIPRDDQGRFAPK